MHRRSARTGLSIGIGLLAATLGVTACQLIAGIDEKVAGESTNDIDAADTSTPGNDGGTDGEQPAPECAKHTDCVAKHGENFICVKKANKPSTCQSLLSPDCQTIIAGVRGGTPQAKQEILQDDNTIFFGFIMDLLGSGKNAGVARRQAVELAAGDIHSVARGIPGGADGKRRPIAWVACSETKDAMSAPDPKVPAKHLIENLNVPAILGASNSDTTIDLFNGYALAQGTLVFSPNSLSSALSSSTDKGLFWRTSATSILQGKAIQQQVAELEATLPAGEHRLAMIYIQDAFGTDIFPHIQSGLSFNGAPITNTAVNGPACSATPCNVNSRIFTKQFPANTPAEVMTAVGHELFLFNPDIVVAIGRRDAVQITANAEAEGLRAYYLFTQGSATADITTLLTANDANGIRGRVRGGRPLAAPDEASVFVPLYNQAFPGGPPSGNGVPGCFDITYLLTYAAAAAPLPPGQILTGAHLNEGLKRVLNKDAVDVFKVGSADLTKALEALSANKQINTKGVSYIFDFDTNVGEAPGKVDIFCVSENSNQLKSSGRVYDPGLDGGITTGTFNCPQN